MEFVPKKLYYKIREVCEIVGVEAHVLRFWETEFPTLAPPKSKNGQRTYRSRDIELILEIRKLLYEDGYTIAGARKHMVISTAAAKKRTTGNQLTDSNISPKPVKPSDPECFPPPNCVPEKSGTSQNPGADVNIPDTERLRRVQKELENILTLLDRE